MSPRYWLDGLLMLLPGLPALGGLWVVWRGLVNKSFFGVGSGIFWFCFFGLFAVLARPNTSSLLLDRSRNTVIADSAGIFFGYERYTVSLDQVRHAHIDTGSASSKRLVLILRSGQHFGFTPFTDRGCQEEAVQAVNDFLGATGD